MTFTIPSSPTPITTTTTTTGTCPKKSPPDHTLPWWQTNNNHNCNVHRPEPTRDPLHRVPPLEPTTDPTRVPSVNLNSSHWCTLAQAPENSRSEQPLATSTPRNDRQNDERDHRPRPEFYPDSRASKNYPKETMKSHRLEEEMKQELRLWSHSNSRSTIGPLLDRMATKRRQWKLPNTGEQEQEKDTSTMQIPRSLTTTLTRPRTTQPEQQMDMACNIPPAGKWTNNISNRYTIPEISTEEQEPRSIISHNYHRMPTWIMAATADSQHNTNNQLQLGSTSTSQNRNTSTRRISNRGNSSQHQHQHHQPPLWQHNNNNSLSRAIKPSPLHPLPLSLHPRLSSGPQFALHREDRVLEEDLAHLNQPESFLSLELLPLPPPPPLRNENEQLRINISSPSLFEDSFNGSQESAHNLTAQHRPQSE